MIRLYLIRCPCWLAVWGGGYLNTVKRREYYKEKKTFIFSRREGRFMIYIQSDTIYNSRLLKSTSISSKKPHLISTLPREYLRPAQSHTPKIAYPWYRQRHHFAGYSPPEHQLPIQHPVMRVSRKSFKDDMRGKTTLSNPLISFRSRAAWTPMGGKIAIILSQIARLLSGLRRLCGRGKAKTDKRSQRGDGFVCHEVNKLFDVGTSQGEKTEGRTSVGYRR